MFRYFFDALDALERAPQAHRPADASLHHGAAFLKEVEQSAGIGFWDSDTASGLVRWSSSMAVIYGAPQGTFKGTSEDFIRRIHPDDVAYVLRQSQAAIDQRSPFDLRFRIVRPDGSVRWVSSRGTAHFDASGACLGFSGFQFDMTAQMQGEAQLRLQAQVITAMADGVLLIDPGSATIVYANPRAEAMLGYAPGALRGLGVADINGRTDQDPQAMADAINQALHRNGSWRGEMKNRCADGREIWASVTVTETGDESTGKIWLSVHADITERRLAQAARDEAMAQLQRLSHSVLVQIEAERTALARDVHDQLGAALTGMRMQLEALSAKLQTLSPALAREAQHIIAQASQTQRDARDICSRLRPALLDDRGLTETCRWYAKEWSRQSGIAIKTRFSALAREPQPRLATDMFRVLQELLTNVARHAGARSVRIALASVESLLVLKVDDDGRGFACDAPTEGFGLIGLRERVRHHGGMLHLRVDANGTRATATMQWQDPP